jgi:hypothetical protein
MKELNPGDAEEWVQAINKAIEIHNANNNQK